MKINIKSLNRSVEKQASRIFEDIIATHHQCRMAYMMECNSISNMQCELGSTSTSVQVQELPYANELHDLVEEMLKFSLSPTATVERYSYASILGTCYRALKCYLFIGFENSELDMEPVPIFSIGWMTFCVWREALYLFANS